MGKRTEGSQLARLATAGAVVGLLLGLAACSGDVTGVPSPQLTTGATPVPALVPASRRATPVVPGRPARMHIAVAFDAKCAPVALKSVALRTPPKAGEVTFKPGQSTVINESANGKCLGSTLTGTGVYYTAKDGTSGRDTFAIDIVMPNGEIATRAFDVTITD